MKEKNGKTEGTMKMSAVWKNRYGSLGEPKEIFTVIIAAAGSGQRMGGVYKPMAQAGGAPLLEYSLKAFEKSGYVKQIAVSAPKEHMEEIAALAKKIGCSKLRAVAEGGETRAESVVNAFRAVFDKKENTTPFLAVHDAARPMITTALADKIFSECTKYGSAVCATKLRDAVKKAGSDNFASEILDRTGIWQMQTPQAFDTDIYHTALASLGTENISNAHDDAAIVMQAGFKVMCVEGGFANFKVTYPEDLELADIILSARNDGKEKSNA